MSQARHGADAAAMRPEVDLSVAVPLEASEEEERGGKPRREHQTRSWNVQVRRLVPHARCGTDATAIQPEVGLSVAVSLVASEE